MNLTVGEIVAKDFSKANVFSKFKIDYCCNGNISLEEACSKINIDKDIVLNELDSIKSMNSDFIFDELPLDLLIDFIEKIHHRYVREKLPIIKSNLDKICDLHSEENPELLEIREIFTSSSSALNTHMIKEETVLFPYIKEMVLNSLSNKKMEKPFFKTVANPIITMKGEHSVEGGRFAEIAKLSNFYTPPENACNTYKVTYSMIQEFEENLHKHIHLENNILFLKAEKLEKQMNQVYINIL